MERKILVRFYITYFDSKTFKKITSDSIPGENKVKEANGGVDNIPC